MKKRLSSLFLVLALSFSLSLSVFAVDDSDYYSLPPVGSSEPSFSISYPVKPSATGDGWNDSDRSLLQAIKIALTDISSGSINWYLTWIYDLLRGDIRTSLGNIDRNTSVTASRILDSNSLLGSIYTAVSGLNGFATENSLSKLVGTFSTPKYDIGLKLADFGELINSAFGAYSTWFIVPDDSGQKRVGFNAALNNLVWGLSSDSTNLYNAQPTLYHMVKLLQETLASEDDRQLAENQKENREEVEKDFLTGQSGSTSLGKGDFSNASQVGGALSDTFNMGGASKVSDFVSGFGSAGQESLSWFSDTTANNLDGVSSAGNSTSGVSTFSDDGETIVDVDPDPYNMAEISERYDWLEGVFG